MAAAAHSTKGKWGSEAVKVIVPRAFIKRLQDVDPGARVDLAWLFHTISVTQRLFCCQRLARVASPT
jgi:hypothetical protein